MGGPTPYPHGVSSYGFPLIGSGPFMSIRATVGNKNEVFFVDLVNGGDGNDGRAPSAAKKTIQAGVDACSNDKGSYVFVGEGETNEQVVIEKRGIHLIGMGQGRTSLEITDAVVSPYTQYTAGKTVTPALVIIPPHLANTPLGVEVAGFRIGVSGGSTYSGVYIGDGASSSIGGAANASYTWIHDNVIDGSALEGTVGVMIAGGSYVKIERNIITGWATYGLTLDAGSVRTCFANIISWNSFLRCTGTGVYCHNKVYSNEVSHNKFVDSNSGAMTTCIDFATGALVHDNLAAGNWFATGGSFLVNDTDNFGCGNYQCVTSATETYVAEE